MTLSKRAVDWNRRGQPPPSLSPVVFVVIVVVIIIVVVVVVVRGSSDHPAIVWILLHLKFSV